MENHIRAYRDDVSGNYFLWLYSMDNGMNALYDYDRGLVYAPDIYLDHCTETYDRNVARLISRFERFYGGRIPAGT